MKKTLLIIPARGNSKGVPRKNIRPLMGKPLIFYAINTCSMVSFSAEVVVSTEDEEISLFAERFGAKVAYRPLHLSEDSVPLDPVISYTVESYEKEHKESIDYVFTVQPTSPLLIPEDLNHCYKLLCKPHIDSVLTVVDDRHLRWEYTEDGKVKPLYSSRVNRQILPATYKETGAIIACKRDVLKENVRIAGNIELVEIPPERSIDIDSDLDFFICESILKRKTIVFVTIGRAEIGLGHVYRSVLLAHELVGHNVIFICNDTEDLAIQYIQSQNYPIQICTDHQIIETIQKKRPDLIINDILDTDEKYVQALKEYAPVVNFEDMGPGTKYADFVINALYPYEIPKNNYLVGPKYFCLRDEFVQLKKKIPNQKVSTVLLTFGGVDEGNLTKRITNLIAPLLSKKNIRLDIVVGPGYLHYDELNDVLLSFSKLKYNLISSTSKISNIMISSDFAITSGGRTVFELASLGIPTMVLCQNERETKHTIVSNHNGFLNLGLHSNVSDVIILESFERMMDYNNRLSMYEQMDKMDLRQGKYRVISILKDLIDKSP